MSADKSNERSPRVVSIKEALASGDASASVRLQLTLKPAHITNLNELLELSGSDNYSEVVRDALRVYGRLRRLDKAGNRIFVEDAQGAKTCIVMW
jgi:hypothetical protein